MFQERATNLFELVQLDHIPKTPKDKDRRYFKRNEVFNVASGELEVWNKICMTECKEEYKNTLVCLALATGFFSVWMEVFKNIPEVQKALIGAFKGTKKEYFEYIIEE